MRIKTCFHWKNIAKTFCVFILVTLCLTLFYTYLELPFILAVVMGIFIGTGAAIYCTECWKLWHFEHQL